MPLSCWPVCFSACHVCMAFALPLDRKLIVALHWDKLNKDVQLSVWHGTVSIVMNREVMKLLTEEQLDRYEAFRRSKLSAPDMRKVQWRGSWQCWSITSYVCPPMPAALPRTLLAWSGRQGCLLLFVTFVHQELIRRMVFIDPKSTVRSEEISSFD